MAGQTTEVNIKLNVNKGSTDGPKMIQDMSNSWEAAAAAEEKYQQKLKNRIKAIQEAERMKKDLQNKGIIKQDKEDNDATAMVGKIAAGVAIAVRSFQQLSNVAKAYGDTSLSAFEKNRQAVEQLPLGIGEVAKAYHELEDVLNGTAQAMAKITAAAKQQNLEFQLGVAVYRQIQDATKGIREGKILGQLVETPFIDTEHKFAVDEEERNLRLAQKREAYLRGDVGGLEGSASSLAAAKSKAAREVADLEERATKGEDVRVALAEKLNKAQGLQKQYLEEQNRLQEKQRELTAATEERLRAQSAVRKDAIREAMEELGILRQQRESVQQTAQAEEDRLKAHFRSKSEEAQGRQAQFQSLSPLEKANALAAASKLKAGGIGSLTQEEKEAGKKADIFKELFAEAEAKAAEGDASFLQGLALTGKKTATEIEERGKRIVDQQREMWDEIQQDLEQQEIDLKADIKLQVNVDAKQLADDLIKELEKRKDALKAVGATLIKEGVAVDYVGQIIAQSQKK